MSPRKLSWIWRDRYNRARDAACRFVVELLPRRVVYFSTIKVWAFATTGEYEERDASSITGFEMIEAWEKNLPGYRPPPTQAERLLNLFTLSDEEIRREIKPVQIKERSIPMNIEGDGPIQRAIKRGQEENGHGET